MRRPPSWMSPRRATISPAHLGLRDQSLGSGAGWAGRRRQTGTRDDSRIRHIARRDKPSKGATRFILTGHHPPHGALAVPVTGPWHHTRRVQVLRIRRSCCSCCCFWVAVRCSSGAHLELDLCVTLVASAAMELGWEPGELRWVYPEASSCPRSKSKSTRIHGFTGGWADAGRFHTPCGQLTGVKTGVVGSSPRGAVGVGKGSLAGPSRAVFGARPG